MTSKLPTGFTARPAMLDDVDAAVAVANACSIEQIGKPEQNAAELDNDWRSPAIQLETDTRVVLDDRGEMAGYAWLWDSAPHVQLAARVYVHPSQRGRGVGAYLGGWLEERARASVAQAPPGARVVLQQVKPTTDETSCAYLEANGYRTVRYFMSMLIEMDEPPPATTFPDGIVVRTLDVGPGEREAVLRDIIHAERDIFRDHWGHVEQPFEKEYDEWAHWVANDPDHDPSIWFLAIDRGTWTKQGTGQIAAVALCAPHAIEDPEMGYILSLGVRRAWRRQGIALDMLHHAFAEFYRRGTRKVSLSVDASSLTGATRLYERAGMHVLRRSVFYDKELRPGVDLSTQSLDT